MTDFCSIDGRLTPLGEGLPGGVYLYQRLRTVDYRPLHTAAHLSRLRDGAGSLFGRPAELPAGRICAPTAIRRAARPSRCGSMPTGRTP